MFNNVSLQNFGPLADLQWKDLGSINLVIGENGCGKTSLLKALSPNDVIAINHTTAKQRKLMSSRVSTK